MAQGVLPFKYEEETKSMGIKALAGLPLYPKIAHKTGLDRQSNNNDADTIEPCRWRRR